MIERQEYERRLGVWLAGLRSGEFPKAAGRLRRLNEYQEEGYCCLGVACEIYRRETGLGAWLPPEPLSVIKSRVFECESQDKDASDSRLPEAVREWFGLHTVQGHLKPRAKIHPEWGRILNCLNDKSKRSSSPRVLLPVLNDRSELSLSDIADVIQDHVSGLFRWA